MQTDIHGYTDKQADRKIQRDKQAGRQRYTVTLTNRQTGRYRETGMQTDIHSYTDKQADMKIQRDRQTCRQTYTVKLKNKQT